MPGTGFTKGINVGKLMGKDYRGVLLVMLAIFRSKKGSSVMKAYQNFRQEGAIEDWILLLELMLEWESYLNEPLMYKKHVKRLEKNAPTIESKIALAYELCFARPPTPEEITLATEFIKTTDWIQFARAMLNANEFVFIP